MIASAGALAHRRWAGRWAGTCWPCYNAGVRELIVSDIHSNLTALETVLLHAQEHGGFQRAWCLGDIVGYGPEPGACLERLWALETVSIIGNHDAGDTSGHQHAQKFAQDLGQVCPFEMFDDVLAEDVANGTILEGQLAPQIHQVVDTVGGIRVEVDPSVENSSAAAEVQLHVAEPAQLAQLAQANRVDPIVPTQPREMKLMPQPAQRLDVEVTALE